MKIKLLSVFELNGQLRVKTETKYGRDNIGLSLAAKYINPATNKPKYIDEVIELLKRKYEPEAVVEKPVDKGEWGKTITT